MERVIIIAGLVQCIRGTARVRAALADNAAAKEGLWEEESPGAGGGHLFYNRRRRFSRQRVASGIADFFDFGASRRPAESPRLNDSRS